MQLPNDKSKGVTFWRFLMRALNIKVPRVHCPATQQMSLKPETTIDHCIIIYHR